MKTINLILTSSLLILCCPKLISAQASDLLPAIKNNARPPEAYKLLPLEPESPQPETRIETPKAPVNPEPQPVVKAAPDTPANFSHVKPALKKKALKQIGLVQRVSPRQITIRSISGAVQTFKISAALNNVPPMSFGSLVSYSLDNRTIKELEVPIVKDVFEGALIVMEDNQLGLLSTAGQLKVTKLSREKISAMNLVVGQTIRVVEFEGIESKIIASPKGNNKAPIYIGEINPEKYSYDYH